MRKRGEEMGEGRGEGWSEMGKGGEERGRRIGSWKEGKRFEKSSQ